MKKIAALVGIAATCALLAYTYLALVDARNTTESPVTISVTGEGEVFAKADIATFSFSVLAQDVTAGGAQQKSAESINKILVFLKEKGVEEKDVKTTGYYLNPRYEYPRSVCTNGYCPPVGEAKIVGYEVSQTIEVRVRNIDDVGMLISGAGDLGATNMSGPSFTIDDDTALKEEAREKAIIDARERGEKLAQDLGVRIVRMTGYSESEVVPYGRAGGVAMMATEDSAAKIAPEIPAGENTIATRVYISYEVR